MFSVLIARWRAPKKDRSRVISLSNGCLVFGVSIGPSIQALFVPVGKEGTKILPFAVNMYTAPAFVMVFVSLLSIFFLIFFFKEDYSGILSEKEKSDPFVVIPKFDRTPAFICIYLWFMFQTIGTSVEVLATPLTISLYDWTNEQALLYNGFLHFTFCSVHVVNYMLMSFTIVGKIEKRLLIIASLICFMLYNLLLLPWPFYSGPLNYIKTVNESLLEDTTYFGGCYKKYEWCAHSVRVPLPIYITAFIVFLGFAFPYMSAPNGIIFTEILGPRKQGMMFGFYTFFGCLARCLTPLIHSVLFEKTGYFWPILSNLFLVSLGFILVIAFRNRLVPLTLKPKHGIPTRYKSGTLYRL